MLSPTAGQEAGRGDPGFEAFILELLGKLTPEAKKAEPWAGQQAGVEREETPEDDSGIPSANLQCLLGSEGAYQAVPEAAPAAGMLSPPPPLEPVIFPEQAQAPMPSVVKLTTAIEAEPQPAVISPGTTAASVFPTESEAAPVRLAEQPAPASKAEPQLPSETGQLHAEIQARAETAAPVRLPEQLAPTSTTGAELLPEVGPVRLPEQLAPASKAEAELSPVPGQARAEIRTDAEQAQPADSTVQYTVQPKVDRVNAADGLHPKPAVVRPELGQTIVAHDTTAWTDAPTTSGDEAPVGTSFVPESGGMDGKPAPRSTVQDPVVPPVVSQGRPVSDNAPAARPEMQTAEILREADIRPIERADNAREDPLPHRGDSRPSWIPLPEDFSRLPGANAVAAVEQSNAHLPPDPVIGSKLIHQIVRAAKVHLFEGGADMTLRLEPPHLGIVRMSVSAQDGMVTASLQTSTETAKRVLEADLTSLRQALADAGVNVDSISVSVTAGFDQSWDMHGALHQGRPGAGMHGNHRFTLTAHDGDWHSVPTDARRQSEGRFDYLA